MSRRSGVLLSYALLLVGMVTSLLFTPFLIRSLGQAEYGLYSLVLSITAYFMLLDAGAGNALVRYVAKYRAAGDQEQQKQLLGLSILFYIGVSIVILLVGAVLQRNLASIFGRGLTNAELKQVGTMLNITLLNAAIALIVSAFDRTIIAYEHFAFSKCLSIVQLLLRVLVLTLLLYAGYEAVAVVFVSLVLTVVFGAISVSYVFVRLQLRPVFKGVQFGFVREILGYSSFVFIQMAATQLNYMSNQVLLGMMASSVAIGVYAVGAQLVQYFHSIASSVNGVLMPGVVRMVEAESPPETLLEEMVKVGRLVFMVLGVVLVTFALCGQSFVVLWAGVQNSEAYWVALVMMAPLTLALSQSIGIQILWAKDRHRVQALLQIGVAVLDIALTIVLIQFWKPAVGAAVATAIAYVIGDVLVLNVIFSRNIGVSMKRYYARLVKGIVPCLAAGVLAGGAVGFLHIAGWLGVVLEGSSVLIVYALTMVAFGLNTYEKDILSSIARGAQQKAS